MSTRQAKYQRRVRAERAEQGLCRDCGAPAAPGKSLCEPHLEALRARVARARARTARHATAPHRTTAHPSDV